MAKQPKLIILWFKGRWETEQCINMNQIVPITLEFKLFDTMGKIRAKSKVKMKYTLITLQMNEINYKANMLQKG